MIGGCVLEVFEHATAGYLCLISGDCASVPKPLQKSSWFCLASVACEVGITITRKYHTEPSLQSQLMACVFIDLRESQVSLWIDWAFSGLPLWPSSQGCEGEHGAVIKISLTNKQNIWKTAPTVQAPTSNQDLDVLHTVSLTQPNMLMFCPHSLTCWCSVHTT